tara:strand:+ start:1914 stop:2156 length:243 start_codon:yes stop_codon:yes gene_type:complete
LLGKEEENLEHDKEFVLKDINNLKLKATKAALRRLSMMRADGNKRMSMMPEDPQGGWAKVRRSAQNLGNSGSGVVAKMLY